MKKILTSTDFSEIANKAVDYAVMIAKGQKTPVDLELLNVYHTNEELPAAILEQHLQKLSRHELFDKTLNEHLKDLPSNINVNGIIRKGPIADTIIKEAQEERVDVLVIGQNGENSLKDWLLGSTTTKIINGTEVPIIAIPKNVKITPPKKIALAIDDRFVPSDKTLQPLFNIVNLFNTELILLHIEQEGTRSNTHKETAIKIARKGYQINLYKKSSNHIGNALLQLAEQHDVDLLCLTRHDYSAWEKMLRQSIVSDITKNSTIPFMVLHDII